MCMVLARDLQRRGCAKTAVATWNLEWNLAAGLVFPRLLAFPPLPSSWWFGAARLGRLDLLSCVCRASDVHLMCALIPNDVRLTQ